MTKLALLCVLALSLGAGVPAVITAGIIGIGDVALYHGCIGNRAANAMPWNGSDQYRCAREP